MKNHTANLISFFFVLFAGVAIAENCDIKIKYIDRNGDKKTDQEIHQYPCMEDADWELLDNNFDGKYETKVIYGIGPIKSEVDIPVHKGKPTNDN